jgi:hypothetical protein
MRKTVILNLIQNLKLQVRRLGPEPAMTEMRAFAQSAGAVASVLLALALALPSCLSLTSCAPIGNGAGGFDESGAALALYTAGARQIHEARSLRMDTSTKYVMAVEGEIFEHESSMSIDQVNYSASGIGLSVEQRLRSMGDTLTQIAYYRDGCLYSGDIPYRFKSELDASLVRQMFDSSPLELDAKAVLSQSATKTADGHALSFTLSAAELPGLTEGLAEELAAMLGERPKLAITAMSLKAAIDEDGRLLSSDALIEADMLANNRNVKATIAIHKAYHALNSLDGIDYPADLDTAYSLVQ